MPTLTDNVSFTRDQSRDWSIYAQSNFVSGSPALNVQHSRPDVRARSTDTTSGTPARVVFNSEAVGAVDPDDYVFMPLYVTHDGDLGTARYRVRVTTEADKDAWSSPTFDSGSGGILFDNPWEQRSFAHAVENDTPATGPYTAGQYVRVDIWASSATFIDIGRIVMGIPWQPPINVQWGSSEPTPMEAAIRDVGSRGQSYSAEGSGYMEAAGSIVFHDEDDMRAFKSFLASVGTNRDLVYHWQPNNSTNLQENLVYGRFDRYAPLNLRAFGEWGSSFSIGEIR